VAIRPRLLTDEIAADLPPPRSGRKEIGDARVKGLFLRVTASGARSWSVLMKVRGQGGLGPNGKPLKGKSRRVTLGSATTLDVNEARRRAQEILREADTGIDPRVSLRTATEKRFTNTVKSVGERMEKAATHSSKARLETILRVHVFPRLGDRPIGDLSRADIIEVLDEFKAEGKIARAREVRKCLTRLFNWAANRAIISTNPIAGLQDNALKYVPVDRSLTDAELRAAWLATDAAWAGEDEKATGYPYKHLTKLLLLTGARLREIAEASWADIDRKERTLRISPERHKSRRGHLIPLSAPAWQIIEDLPTTDGQKLLFVTRAGKAPEFKKDPANKFRAAVHAQLLEDNKKHGDLDHFRIHDLRHTTETHMAKLGVAQEHIDRVLGHAMKGMSRTYNHHSYIEEKRAALDKYAAHILGLAQ
jgi:integrase